MRPKLYRLRLCVVQMQNVLDDHKDLVYDYHYFEDPYEIEAAYHMFYMHYNYRKELFKREEFLEIRIEKWISPQSTMPTGRWTELSLDDLYKSDEELY